MTVGFIALTLLTGCARDLSSNVYTDRATQGMAVEGVIVSMRPVTIQNTDKLGENQAGTIGGGVLGAATAGSLIGRGNGSLVAAIGGAIAGAVAGAAIEGQLSKSQGIEYIVKVTGRNPMRNPSRNQSLVTVVQDNKELFSINQRVYVIYSGDRARLVAIQG